MSKENALENQKQKRHERKRSAKNIKRGREKENAAGCI